MENGRKYHVQLRTAAGEEWNIQGLYNKKNNSIKMNKGVLFSLEKNDEIINIVEIERNKRVKRKQVILQGTMAHWFKVSGQI